MSAAGTRQMRPKLTLERGVSPVGDGAAAASDRLLPADKGEPIDGSRRRNTGTPHRQVGGRLCSIGGFALVVAKVDPIRLSGAATSRSARGYTLHARDPAICRVCPSLVDYTIDTLESTF